METLLSPFLLGHKTFFISHILMNEFYSGNVINVIYLIELCFDLFNSSPRRKSRNIEQVDDRDVQVQEIEHCY